MFKRKKHNNLFKLLQRKDLKTLAISYGLVSTCFCQSYNLQQTFPLRCQFEILDNSLMKVLICILEPLLFK